jgi:probable rRNA maturation factor
MKLRLEINNQEKNSLPKKYFEDVILKTIKNSGVKLSGGVDMSLAIVSGKEIKKINKAYRKKNKVTDILSFSDYSGKNSKKDIFCELIVCLPYVEKSAKEDKITLKKEMAYVISHGVLHCVGFNHSKKMFEIQDAICNSVH